MRKFIDILSESTEETHEAERFRAFEALADAQRGAPEIAMVQAQKVMGGGVLNWAIEHVGDLTHRMAEHPDWIPNSGYEFVAPKVHNAVKNMTSAYGFEREFRENIRNNATYYEKDVGEYFEKVKRALAKYSDEHEKLVVYNEAQTLARDAAVHLGRLQFDKALACLLDLQQMLVDPKTWHSHASKFN